MNKSMLSIYNKKNILPPYTVPSASQYNDLCKDIGELVIQLEINRLANNTISTHFNCSTNEKNTMAHIGTEHKDLLESTLQELISMAIECHPDLNNMI